ncbi:tyrosine-protein phosphatase [Aeromicrobium sp. Marseille-Q0843]|uniref:Tyrosine-protein phosphatase n=1 Tax=Aeromicrobium phoceense TaxID=2754045 RepID=A0A838XEA6_9ACTN|nr:tyrosine-protein phosphatase [Aeromicrobium phoceense]
MNETVPNLRDLGGTPVEGGVIRTGRLLRSALPLPDDVAPPEIEWPPTVVIDLRSLAETEPEHPLSAPGVTVLNFPLLSALRPGVAPPESLAELYQLMLRTTADHLVEVVDAVASAEDATTLVHCAAGKDRTGVSIAMVLALLGAKRDDIVEDYLATAQHEEQIQARFRRLFGQRSAELPAAYIATPVEAISGVLDTWDEHPGGALGWFHHWGGRPETVDRLRTTLVG